MRSAALLLLLAACSGPGYRDPEDSEEMRDEIGDRNIATRVRIALNGDPETAAYERIEVTCVRGVVTLSGSVDRESVRKRAVRVARGCEGVERVVVRITVGPAGRT